ncbi:MAG TPA: ABC transporter permease [Vicinamibacterales bacterium]|nr:ABC transporter permease [Vicinamibacterales bacterium]
MKRSLRSWLWRVPLEQEVDEEIAFHIEMRTRDLVERGIDPKTARDLVLSRLGDLGRLKRTCIDLGRKRDREMRVTQWFEERRDDITFALRQLRASPGFALVAAITLALGIGANSAMFALADATLIRPLPYPDADRLVMVWERNPEAFRTGVSPVNLRDWEEQSRTFEALAAVAFGAGGGPLVEAPDGSLQSAERQTVTARFFQVLGITPVAGRTFRPADAERGAVPVVVMGEGLWRTRFGGDPTLIGRDIRLNGEPFTVIGIVRDEVQLQRPARIWTLLPEVPMNLPRGARFLQVIGRLKAGVTLDAAQSDLAVVADRLAHAYPETNKDWGVLVEPLRNGVMGPDLRLTSLLLLGVVGCVLLLCCANVANLVLARGSARARELAVRSALGAGKSRIVSQLLTESLVLAAFGGLLGAAVGAAILKIAPTLIPAGLLPAAARIAFDGRVAVFCTAAAFGVGVLFGLVPAWQATRTSLVQAISSDSRSATRTGGRFRSLLAAGQVAAAVLLLCGAGLLLRSLLVLGSFDTGYRADSDSVLTLDFSVDTGPGTRYPTWQSLTEFYDDATREIAAVPGIRTIGWSTGLPYGETELGRQRFEIIGDPPIALANRPVADFQAASPGYFTTLDLPVVAGRAFTERDTSDSTPVCIVNEAFVRRHLAGRNPIGVRVNIDPVLPGLTVAKVREIVGVARQMKGRVDESEDQLQVYVPLAQFPWADTYLVVQASAGQVAALLTPIREAVARIDRNVPVRREKTLTDLAALTAAPHRFRAVLVGTFAALALALAMVGLYGVLAYSVEQRTRELGVRIALGATATSVLGLILGGAARMVAIGGAVGLVAAAGLAQTISMFLFRVQPLDPLTFASAAVLLLLTAAVATAAPAWRATRVDPVVAFRNE